MTDPISTLDGSTVLLTGATGFVGSTLVRRLVGVHGCNVHAMVRPGGGDRRSVTEVQDRVVWHEVDLTSAVAIREVVREVEPRFVFHLATYYAVDRSGVDLADMVEVNVTSGLLLVDACVGLEGLQLVVDVGTCAEYGDVRVPADEMTPIDPNSVYASTKAAGVVAHRQHARDSGVPLTVLRLYNMYGPRERPVRITPHVAMSLMRGDRVPLTGCEQAKDYTYVEDVVDAFVAAVRRAEFARGQVFNIGSGRPVTMRRFVETIADRFEGGRELLGFGEVPYRENEMWLQVADARKAADLLGWSPAHSLEEGLAETVDWYRDCGEAWYE